MVAGTAGAQPHHIHHCSACYCRDPRNLHHRWLSWGMQRSTDGRCTCHWCHAPACPCRPSPLPSATCLLLQGGPCRAHAVPHPPTHPHIHPCQPPIQTYGGTPRAPRLRPLQTYQHTAYCCNCPAPAPAPNPTPALQDLPWGQDPLGTLTRSQEAHAEAGGCCQGHPSVAGGVGRQGVVAAAAWAVLQAQLLSQQQPQTAGAACCPSLLPPQRPQAPHEGS